MKSTENLDTLYLELLLSELKQISDELTEAWRRDRRFNTTMAYSALVRIDQLRVRITKDLAEMQETEAKAGFGSIPDLTGEMETMEFLRNIRGG